MERVQSCWRSYKIRKKVLLFKTLPQDLWYVILEHIRQEPDVYKFVNNVLHLRIIRLYWIPPGRLVNRKLKILYLVRKYLELLKPEVIEASTRLCFRLLKHYVVPYCHRLLINATIEKIIVSHPGIIERYITLY